MEAVIGNGTNPMEVGKVELGNGTNPILVKMETSPNVAIKSPFGVPKAEAPNGNGISLKEVEIGIGPSLDQVVNGTEIIIR